MSDPPFILVLFGYKLCPAKGFWGGAFRFAYCLLIADYTYHGAMRAKMAAVEGPKAAWADYKRKQAWYIPDPDAHSSEAE